MNQMSTQPSCCDGLCKRRFGFHACRHARPGAERISTQLRCSSCSACPYRCSGSRADSDSDIPPGSTDRRDCACASTHSCASQKPGSRAYQSRRVDKLRTTDPGGSEVRGQSRPDRLLDVYLHQLYSDSALLEGVAREVRGQRSGDSRRPHSRI